MRKSIIEQETAETKKEQGWLDLEELAHVEISSEEPSHPIESALKAGAGPGWRAAGPGKQTIRLRFDRPLTLRRIELRFDEQERPRTQEFVLRWSQGAGASYRDIVRQQYNFTPPGTSREVEEYSVNLAGVTALELEITPDISGSPARASLTRLRISGG